MITKIKVGRRERLFCKECNKWFSPYSKKSHKEHSKIYIPPTEMNSVMNKKTFSLGGLTDEEKKIEKLKKCGWVPAKYAKGTNIKWANDKEICICAAIQMPDGYIVRGHRHNDCFRTISGIPRYKGINLESLEDGFMTTRNRFVNRFIAKQLQDLAGIKSVDKNNNQSEKILYSEDLY